MAALTIYWSLVMGLNFQQHVKTRQLNDFSPSVDPIELSVTSGVPPSALRIQTTLKVYGEQLFDFRDGKREKDIYIQGIEAHPHVTLVDTPEEADFVIFVTGELSYLQFHIH